MARSSTDVVDARVSLREEMAGGDLGDDRLNARRNRLIDALEQSPATGVAEACARDGDVEARYRFLRNRARALGAGKLVGKGFQAEGGIGEANAVHGLQGAGVEGSALQAPVQHQGLADLLFYGVQRFEAGHRLLEDHGDMRAADVAQARFARPHQFFAAVSHRA